MFDDIPHRNSNHNSNPNPSRREKRRWVVGCEYLDGVTDSEAGDCVSAEEAVGNGEAAEAVVTPEAGRGRDSDELLELPRGDEGPDLHVGFGGDRVPAAADAGGTCEVGQGEALEDASEDVP